MTKDPNDMTRAELLAVPTLPWMTKLDEFDWVIIVPNRRKHDSGYGCMTYVFGSHKKGLIGKSPGGSDVLFIGGISSWLDGPPTGWQIDLLYKSQCVRLFSRMGEGSLDTGGFSTGLSAVEVMTKDQHRSHEERMKEVRIQYDKTLGNPS